jgi:hypothetical protein
VCASIYNAIYKDGFIATLKPYTIHPATSGLQLNLETGFKESDCYRHRMWGEGVGASEETELRLQGRGSSTGTSSSHQAHQPLPFTVSAC